MGSRSTNWLGYVKFIQDELSKESVLKTSDSEQFESQNIFSEFVEMITEETLKFPSNCSMNQTSACAFLHISSGIF